MRQLAKRFVRDDAGQDLIEYVLLASFIAAAVIGGATAMGGGLNAWYTAIGTWVTNNAGKF